MKQQVLGLTRAMCIMLERTRNTAVAIVTDFGDPLWTQGLAAGIRRHVRRPSGRSTARRIYCAGGSRHARCNIVVALLFGRRLMGQRVISSRKNSLRTCGGSCARHWAMQKEGARAQSGALWWGREVGPRRGSNEASRQALAAAGDAMRDSGGTLGFTQGHQRSAWTQIAYTACVGGLRVLAGLAGRKPTKSGHGAHMRGTSRRAGSGRGQVVLQWQAEGSARRIRRSAGRRGYGRNTQANAALCNTGCWGEYTLIVCAHTCKGTHALWVRLAMWAMRRRARHMQHYVDDCPRARRLPVKGIALTAVRCEDNVPARYLLEPDNVEMHNPPSMGAKSIV